MRIHKSYTEQLNGRVIIQWVITLESSEKLYSVKAVRNIAQTKENFDELYRGRIAIIKDDQEIEIDVDKKYIFTDCFDTSNGVTVKIELSNLQAAREVSLIAELRR